MDLTWIEGRRGDPDSDYCNYLFQSYGVKIVTCVLDICKVNAPPVLSLILWFY